MSRCVCSPLRLALVLLLVVQAILPYRAVLSPPPLRWLTATWS
jgi:hypothetical protein